MFCSPSNVNQDQASWQSADKGLQQVRMNGVALVPGSFIFDPASDACDKKGAPKMAYIYTLIGVPGSCREWRYQQGKCSCSFNGLTNPPFASFSAWTLSNQLNPSWQHFPGHGQRGIPNNPMAISIVSLFRTQAKKNFTRGVLSPGPASVWCTLTTVVAN